MSAPAAPAPRARRPAARPVLVAALALAAAFGAGHLVGRGRALPLARAAPQSAAAPPAAAPPPPEAPAPPPPPAPGAAAAACAADFPWHAPALEHFFAPARAEAAASAQPDADAAFAAMAAVRWGEYAPGQDLVTLKYDAAAQRYRLSSKVVHPANRAYKSECMLRVLADAVAAFGGADALGADLRFRDLRLVVETEDFPLNRAGSGARLPAFSMCAEPGALDVPAPDFTFACYPETRYANSSWPAVHALLTNKAGMTPWAARAKALFARGHWGVGPRRGLMPPLAAMRANGTDEGALGARVDVGDTGFTASDDRAFAFLDAWCASAFHLHTAGFSYSASLKYKLACGAVVVKFDSRFEEWYEPGLIDGEHVLRLPATHEGVDEAEFFAASAPRIKALVEKAAGGGEGGGPPAMAAAAAAFAARDLGPRGVACYWYAALRRYAELYYAEGPAAAKVEAAEPAAAGAAAPPAAAAAAAAKRQQGRKEGGREA